MGPLVRYLTSRDDLDLMRRAIKGNWPLTDENKAKMADKLLELCDSPNHSVAVKAMRVLQMAMADDNRFLLSTLQMIQQDEVAGTVPYIGSSWFTPEDETDQRLLEASPEELHEYLQGRSKDPKDDSVDEES